MTCQSVEQEENHEKGPRWSWARNQMGNSSLKNPQYLLTNLIFGVCSSQNHRRLMMGQMPIRINYFMFNKSLFGAALGVLAVLLPLPLCVHGQPCIPPPSGLVSWWQAESNALDSADGNNGTLVGNVTYAPGRVGQAFSFDGTSSYVSIPSTGNINFSGTMPMTIETWVYRTGGASVMNIVGKRNACSLGEIQYQLAFDPAAGLSFGSGNGVLVGTQRQLPMNTWQHLAATYDGTTVVVYINGQAVASGAGSLGAATTAPLEIGRSGDCELFAGLIDEVSIYNRGLSAAEIQSIYTADGAGKCKLPDCSQQLAAVQAQLVAANAAVASLQAQLAACNNAVASDNQQNQDLQNEILGLLLPLQNLTHDWQILLHRPSFQIPGATPVEQMQNLVAAIEDLQRSEQLELLIKLDHEARRHEKNKK